jgi:hypothetical protein
MLDDCLLSICEMFAVDQTSSDVCGVDGCGTAMREVLDYGSCRKF